MSRRHIPVRDIHHRHRFHLAFCDSDINLNCKNSSLLNNKNPIYTEGRRLENNRRSIPEYHKVYRHHVQRTFLQCKSNRLFRSFSQHIERNLSLSSRQAWELEMSVPNRCSGHRICTSDNRQHSTTSIGCFRWGIVLCFGSGTYFLRG